ncbi:splicing factor 3B subunit 2-like isoform X2 [Bolinopsis microptera]|uniref:splicing factor 3B subunit 2-like isoform X2 n=1 Tax=Bolinopsis microptera TaxID=2820187 RepID=UPI0030796FB2
MSDPQVPESLNLNLPAPTTPSDVQLEVAASPTSGPSASTSGTRTSVGEPGAASSPMSPDSVSGANIAQLNLEQPPTALDWEEVSSEASDAINNVVSGIVDRMRIERMFELRRIQHGDRAVSTGETAQQLEEFFTRDQNDTIRAPRSEGVQNELELLTRNRSVGNLLNTRFRTLLENSLRAPPQPTTRSTPSTRTGPLPPPPPPGAPRVPPAPPVPGALPPNESTAARLERETVAAHMSQAALQAAEQYEPPDFANRQFDYAISDVEELFQRRLVSDVLHSTFRNVLELHIERRLVRAGVEPRPRGRAQAAPQPQPQPGASGQQAQPAINPFTGTPHVRPLVEPSSSRRIPEIERQIHVMSIEMKEMKGMLKLLVDTQLEMQRAVRQEVSAMMRSSTVEPAKPTKQVKEGTCVVCLEYPCDTVLYRCGHLCCCFSCARALKVAGHHCPVCRAEVSDILRIYRST